MMECTQKRWKRERDKRESKNVQKKDEKKNIEIPNRLTQREHTKEEWIGKSIHRIC